MVKKKDADRVACSWGLGLTKTHNFICLIWVKTGLYFMGGFTVVWVCVCVFVLHGISMLGWIAPVVLTVGGECRPSTWSDSASWASPWITAKPRRSRSANDWALHSHTHTTHTQENSLTMVVLNNFLCPIIRTLKGLQDVVHQVHKQRMYRNMEHRFCFHKNSHCVISESAGFGSP